MRPTRVQFEHLGPDALGIGTPTPRLSWQAAGRSYEIRGRDPVTAQEWTAWSDERVLVPWVGPPLRSRERRLVSVRVDGADWSEESFVEAGLLETSEWSAVFVGPPAEAGPVVLRSPEIGLGEVVSARLYVTARGVYEVDLNGRRVGDDVLAPGWQSYHHRLAYRTHDVTELLRGQEQVVIGAHLADGWYRGRLGFPLIVRDRVYGDDLGLLAQLDIEFADGRREVVASDGSWMWAPGPVTSADLYNGEHYDARVTPQRWSPARVSRIGPIDLVAPTGPPVRRTEELHPVAVLRSAAGNPILDFGQNLVGWLRITVTGEPGATIELRHAEVLDGGELALAPLRTAKATDRYTIASRETETWEPRFTYHGFRYAEVMGWPGQFDAADVTALVIHSDLERTGWFTTDDESLNRLHENVVWSLRGNFVSIPTDCPQRDERLGWTGDIGVFAPTAAYLYDVSGFLESWLDDLAREQRPDGTVPFFVPELELPGDLSHVPGLHLAPAAVWGDAAVTVPMAIHDAYGDEGILRRQYPSMTRWVDRVLDLAGPSRIWDTGFQFGDWLDPSAPPDDPSAAMTETALVATAYLVHSTALLARAAGILGENVDASRYADASEQVRRAFADRFWAGGRLTSDTQTAYALALCFDLLGPREVAEAGERLAALVRANGHRIGTGFVGTPLILEALTRAGYLDDAYRLLLQTEAPSWLYTVGMGATTIWERWDSMLPDGSINPGEMTSFNHYALGAVAQWMHSTIGGVQPLEPGYRVVRVAPRPGAGIRSASTAHESPYGRIEVAWRLGDDDELHLDVTLPPGVTGVIESGDHPERVGAGRHRRRYPSTEMIATPTGGRA